jgi:hypothetical protein
VEEPAARINRLLSLPSFISDPAADLKDLDRWWMDAVVRKKMRHKKTSEVSVDASLGETCD